MENNYPKKSIWKWILIYVLIGFIVYGAIYYFFFYKKGGYLPNNQEINNINEKNTAAQIPAGTAVYKNVDYGFEFSYLTKDLCSGSGGGDSEGNRVLISLCPAVTSGSISISVKNNAVVNGVLHDAYLINLDKPTMKNVGGKTAYQYSINQGTDGCQGYLTAIPVSENKTLEITLDNCGAGQVNDPNFPNNGVGYMNELLSTFIFTK